MHRKPTSQLLEWEYDLLDLVEGIWAVHVATVVPSSYALLAEQLCEPRHQEGYMLAQIEMVSRSDPVDIAYMLTTNALFVLWSNRHLAEICFSYSG